MNLIYGTWSATDMDIRTTGQYRSATKQKDIDTGTTYHKLHSLSGQLESTILLTHSIHHDHLLHIPCLPRKASNSLPLYNIYLDIIPPLLLDRTRDRMALDSRQFIRWPVSP